jgi:hypothetical protein
MEYQEHRPEISWNNKWLRKDESLDVITFKYLNISNKKVKLSLQQAMEAQIVRCRLTDGGEVVSLIGFTQQEDSWYLFLLEAVIPRP